MGTEQQIEQVMREWNTHQEWSGKGYGVNDQETLQAMAALAVRALRNEPNTVWAAGAVIPRDVDRVRDRGGAEWVRERDGDGDTSGVWVTVTSLEEVALLEDLGPVTKFEQGTPTAQYVPWDPPAVTETCPRCGDEGPHDQIPAAPGSCFPGRLGCSECHHQWYQVGVQCRSMHQEYGWVCDRHQQHQDTLSASDRVTWHHDGRVGHRWDGMGRDTLQEAQSSVAVRKASEVPQLVPAESLTRLAEVTIEVLTEAMAAAGAIDKAYRDGRKWNAGLARSSRTAAERCQEAINHLQSLTGGG